MRSRVAGKVRAFAVERIPRSFTRPFQNLPSRIILSVFAAALVTSLVVTWMSTRTIEAFLRAKIDQKFPTTLRSTGERLDLWYAQRELDLYTFAGSAIVAESAGRLGGRGKSAASARDELTKYLAYVLERFPQYEALFLMDTAGNQLLRVGEDFELPEMRLRQLADVRAARVSGLMELRGRRVQLASAAVVDQQGRRRASLHAMLGMGSLEQVLRSDDLGPSGGIYVAAPGGEILLSSPAAPPLEWHARPLPLPDARPVVEDYTHGQGEHVVGSAVHFPRFGWTILVEQAYDEAFAPVMAVIREILAINLGIVLVFGLIAFQIARSIVRPIRALSGAALRIATGETEVEIEEPPSADEIGVLTQAFNEMSRRLRENRHELERNRVEIEDANTRLVAQNQELHRVSEVFQQLSITDDLTKLHNHRFFQEQLPREMKRSDRTDHPLCLILMDIDDFKSLNDRFGHAVGDAVLRKVADVMRKTIREMDLLARYGGEEFVLLLSDTSLEGAAAVAEKIRVAIANARFSVVDLDGPTQVGITASFGVAQYSGDAKTFFGDADRALYRAKAAGKDCVVAGEAPSG